MDRKTRDLLVDKAIQARAHAYVPYSGFAVGAALLGEDGNIYTGCNIENASFGATNCAERTAVFSAINQGVQKFKAVAVAGGKAGVPVTDICPPCGICRQVLMEFCDSDTPLLLTDGSGEIKEISLGELLPYTFTKNNMS